MRLQKPKQISLQQFKRKSKSMKHLMTNLSKLPVDDKKKLSTRSYMQINQPKCIRSKSQHNQPEKNANRDQNQGFSRQKMFNAIAANNMIKHYTDINSSKKRHVSDLSEFQKQDFVYFCPVYTERDNSGWSDIAKPILSPDSMRYKKFLNYLEDCCGKAKLRIKRNKQQQNFERNLTLKTGESVSPQFKKTPVLVKVKSVVEIAPPQSNLKNNPRIAKAPTQGINFKSSKNYEVKEQYSSPIFTKQKAVSQEDEFNYQIQKQFYKSYTKYSEIKDQMSSLELTHQLAENSLHNLKNSFKLETSNQFNEKKRSKNINYFKSLANYQSAPKKLNEEEGEIKEKIKIPTSTQSVKCQNAKRASISSPKFSKSKPHLKGQFQEPKRIQTSTKQQVVKKRKKQQLSNPQKIQKQTRPHNKLKSPKKIRRSYPNLFINNEHKQQNKYHSRQPTQSSNQQATSQLPIQIIRVKKGSHRPKMSNSPSLNMLDKMADQCLYVTSPKKKKSCNIMKGAQDFLIQNNFIQQLKHELGKKLPTQEPKRIPFQANLSRDKQIFKKQEEDPKTIN